MQIAAEGMRHTLLFLMKLGLSVHRFGGALRFLYSRVCGSNALACLVAAQTDAGFFTVGGRVFTLATTPPALDSFFDDFCKKIRSENEQGKYFFQLTNHSLVCEKCIEKYLAAVYQGTISFDKNLDDRVVHIHAEVPAESSGTSWSRMLIDEIDEEKLESDAGGDAVLQHLIDAFTDYQEKR